MAVGLIVRAAAAVAKQVVKGSKLAGRNVKKRGIVVGKKQVRRNNIAKRTEGAMGASTVLAGADAVRTIANTSGGSSRSASAVPSFKQSVAKGKAAAPGKRVMRAEQKLAPKVGPKRKAAMASKVRTSERKRKY
jgi:hypothetical protein